MAALMPFASPADMASRTQGEISEATHPFLASELLAASRRIRAFCGWHVAPTVDLVWKSSDRHGRNVWLPAMEVVEVTEILVDGVATTSDPAFNRRTGYLDLSRVGSELGWWDGTRWEFGYPPVAEVEVRYRAGFDPIPDDLVSLCLAMAARGLGSPLGYTREAAGSVSVTFSSAGAGVSIAAGSGLLEHEKLELTGTYKLGLEP